MKYDLAIAIRVGSPNSTLHLVKETFESLSKNIGRCQYKFLISLDPSVKRPVKDYLYQLNKSNSRKYQILHEERVYWAEFINEAISKSQDAEYFIKAHDDIKLLTPNFFPKVTRIIATLKESIGWISFTEANYLYRDYYYGPSTRPGWHSDFYNGGYAARKMFQFHFLPDHWWQGNPLLDGVPVKLGFLPRKTSSGVLSRIDLPSSPVKCHAPYNMFVMIKTRTLNKIGACENWQTYNALLVDEDWGLRAMQLKYWNIWISGIQYLHLRPPGLRYGNRSQHQVQSDAKRVHRLFVKKWGFDNPCPKSKLPLIKKRYHSTNIPWSIGRLSFDWDYIKSSKA